MYNYVGADLLSRQGAILSCHVTTFGRSWRLFVVSSLLEVFVLSLLTYVSLNGGSDF